MRMKAELVYALVGAHDLRRPIAVNRFLECLDRSGGCLIHEFATNRQVQGGAMIVEKFGAKDGRPVALRSSGTALRKDVLKRKQ